jgi:hypothetical protein
MSISFPEGPSDNTVLFHNEMVCIYHEATNTWECRRITPQDEHIQQTYHARNA